MSGRELQHAHTVEHFWPFSLPPLQKIDDLKEKEHYSAQQKDSDLDGGRSNLLIKRPPRPNLFFFLVELAMVNPDHPIFCCVSQKKKILYLLYCVVE